MKRELPILRTLELRALGLLVVLGLGAQLACGQSAPSSFAYVLQADRLARTKVAAGHQLAGCGRDWLVLDAEFSGGTPWTCEDLDALRNAREGRKVIAYLSIGEAEDYRPYWRKEWGTKGKPTAAAPVWLGPINPEWKGNYRVKYWHPQWQQLMLGAIDSAMACGFDGVYLDIVDGFETYEQDGRKFIDNRINPETKQSYRRDMVDWVKTIAARARTRKANALVIPQNGSQLLAHADFIDIINAIGIEDLFTEGNKLQPWSHTAEVLQDLKRMEAAHKPVLLIEYPTNAQRQAMVKVRAREKGLLWLITDRQLRTLGESGR